jgi:nucleoside-diphosphate-sugar epimerase
MTNSLAKDLDHILCHTEGLWEELRGQRIFITGGTGFFGCWLLESFTWANDKLGLNAVATLLTRNPAAFQEKAPHLAGHPAVRLLAGDVRWFPFPEGGFSHIIHAATDSSTKLNETDPLAMLDTIIQGTRRTLDFGVACGAGKFLLVSSGAVYGEQPPDLSHIPETYAGAPDTMDPRSAYGEGKRVAELLCAVYHREHGIQTKIARGFAFVGPYLPLDAHFAIGNFVRDAMRGGPIRVKGDGRPLRSYLYAADLAIWLWTILMKGEPCRPYNVGSDEALSVGQAASYVAQAAGGIPVEIAERVERGTPRRRYVPGTGRVREELKLRQGVPLDSSVAATFAWHKR